jgi:integrase
LQIDYINIHQRKIRYFESFISKGFAGYYYLYYFDFEREKREKKSTRTRIQSQAFRFMEKFKKTYLNNRSQIDVNTIADLRDIILKYQSNVLEKGTLDLYKRILNNLINIISNKPLRLVTFLDLERYKATRIIYVKPVTVNIELRTLKAAFNYAKKLGAIIENPVNPVKQLVIPDKPRLCFSDDELKSLISKIDRDIVRNFTLLNLYTGCRLSEVVNLQWQDIDFENGTIYIRNKEGFKTKTRKERKIPISKDLLELLKNMRGANDEGNVLQYYKPEDYLFPKKDGTKYSTSHFSKLFKKQVLKAGLDKRLHYHDMRHTALTCLARKNVPLYQIKEIIIFNIVETENILNKGELL